MNSNSNTQQSKPVVLVIEDDRNVSDSNRQILEANGCEVIVVAGIKEFRGDTAIGIGLDKKQVIEIDLSAVKAATVDYVLADDSLFGPSISMTLVKRGIKTCAATKNLHPADMLPGGDCHGYGFSTYVENKHVNLQNIDRVFAALDLVRPQT